MRVSYIKPNTRGIYCILNLVNQKLYIGSSKNIQQRLYKHRALLRKGKHENAYLQSSFTKHGEDNFYCFVVEECEQLPEREQYWLDLLVADYNLQRSVFPIENTEASRKKISATLLEGYRTGRVKPTRQKQIKQHAKTGELLTEWVSIAAAARGMGIDQTGIARCLNGSKQSWGGYLWRYSTDTSTVAPLQQNRRWNQVVLTDVISGEENCFRSLASACEYLGVNSTTLGYSYKNKALYKNRYMVAKARVKPI